MRISGGTMTPITLKVLPNFRPVTELALNYVKLSNGNYGCTDRTASGDTYESDIELYGREDAIQAFFTVLQTNRNDGIHFFTLDQFNAGEKIFGADVDYTTSITATVVDIKKKQQQSLKSFSLSLRIRAIGALFIGTPVLPALKPLIGYEGDSTFEVDKQDSYFGDMSYSDLDKDSGTFSATYHFTQNDMQAIRRYLATVRGSAFSVSDLAGVTKPFGNRLATYPISVKAVSWKDLGMIAWGINSDVRCWAMQLNLAEVI